MQHEWHFCSLQQSLSFRITRTWMTSNFKLFSVFFINEKIPHQLLARMCVFVYVCLPLLVDRRCFNSSTLKVIHSRQRRNFRCFCVLLFTFSARFLKQIHKLLWNWLKSIERNLVQAGFGTRAAFIALLGTWGFATNDNLRMLRVLKAARKSEDIPRLEKFFLRFSEASKLNKTQFEISINLQSSCKSDNKRQRRKFYDLYCSLLQFMPPQHQPQCRCCAWKRNKWSLSLNLLTWCKR